MTSLLRLTAAPLHSRGPAGAFVLTDAQVVELGAGKKTFPVVVGVNGQQLSLRLARMGTENLIGLARAARAQAGVEIGESYDIEVSLDTSERTVEVPADLQTALTADPAVAAAFAALAYSHRKEHVRWINEAKREATRADRIAKTVERIRSAG